MGQYPVDVLISVTCPYSTPLLMRIPTSLFFNDSFGSLVSHFASFVFWTHSLIFFDWIWYLLLKLSCSWLYFLSITNYVFHLSFCFQWRILVSIQYWMITPGNSYFFFFFLAVELCDKMFVKCCWNWTRIHVICDQLFCA